MNVALLNYTPNAERLLVFGRRTRLTMSVDSFQEVMDLPQAEIDRELKLVFGTIGSGWEFVDYVFLVTGVSRAFTHQFVRHRIASFAQQTQRAINLSDGFDYVASGKTETDPAIAKMYGKGMEKIRECYSGMVALGADIQDARGILPTNITTNIMAKFNLRTLSGMMNERLCFRVQGEFQAVARAMKDRVLEVHPWADPILQVNCVQHGVCKFKNFKDCPMKVNGFIKDPDSEMLRKEWEKTTLSVQPKV